MKPRYTDAFWGKYPFDEEMILYKNKNKNKCVVILPGPHSSDERYRDTLLYREQIYPTV